MNYNSPVIRISVVGKGWYGQTMATKYTARLDAESVAGNIPEFTREAIEEHLTSHAGDFQVVTDFSAVVKGLRHCDCCKSALWDEIPFATEEGEMMFCDCMEPMEY